MARFIYAISAFYVMQTTSTFAIVDTFIYGTWANKGGDKFSRSMNALLFVASLWLFSQGFRRVRSIRVGMIFLLALVGFLLLSAAWSIEPQTTIQRGVIYLFVVLGAIGIAGSLDGDEFMGLLVLTCGVTAVASLVLLAISPGYALANDGSRAFQGILSGKNQLGQAMAVGVLGSLHGVRKGGRGRLRNVGMFALFTVLALASQSSTACLAILIICAMDCLGAMFRKGRTARAIGVILLVLLGPPTMIVAIFPDSFLELIGKDPSLTGRTDLWEYVLTNIDQRPILGWGYDAFWSQNNPAANEISTALGWNVPQAHNGILEMLLEVGMIGTTLFIILFVRNVLLALRGMRTPAKNLGITLLLCSGSIILIGITELILINPNQASSSVFIIVGLLCERSVSFARRRRYSRAVSRDMRIHETIRILGVSGDGRAKRR